MLKICNILLRFYGFGFMAVITRQQVSVEHSEKPEIKHPVVVLRNGEDQTRVMFIRWPEICFQISAVIYDAKCWTFWLIT